MSAVAPMPCAYCAGPIPESRGKMSVHCGDDCGRAAAALRFLRTGKRQRYQPPKSPCESCGVTMTRWQRCGGCITAEREAQAAEFERQTSADLAVLVHPRPPSLRQKSKYAESRLIAATHRCHRCGIDTTRPDMCADCEEVA